MEAISALTVISLVASSLGAVLAIVAIALTLALFFASHKTSLSILDFLSDIKASASSTEASQKETIRGLIGAITQSSTSKAVEEESNVLAQVDQILKEEDGFTDDAARKRLGSKIGHILSQSYNSLAYRLSTIPQDASGRISGGLDVRDASWEIPVGTYRVLKWMLENEKSYEFFGVKFLRDTIFKADPAAQAALQGAIEAGMLSLYKVDNPLKPEWKTTACRLNLKHRATIRVLESVKSASV